MISAAELLIGTALTAAAFGLIILPQGFAAAGVTGFARTVTRFIPIPLSVMVFIVNMLLMILGLVFVGRRFVAKTIVVSVLFPIMLEIFSHYPLNVLGEDATLCTVITGAMLGTGAGLILRSGASSGGFDILAVILNQKYKLPVATVMNICDVLVILMQALGKPFLPTVYGILTITISAAIVSHVITLGTVESQIMVYSEHHEEIRSVLGKGYTLDKHFNPPMLT